MKPFLYDVKVVKQFSFGAFYKPINMFNQAWEKYSSVLLNLKYWGVNPRRLISNNVMSRLRDRSHPGIFCLKHFLPGKFYGGEKINYRVLQSALTRVLTDLTLEVYPKWILSTKPWNLASCFVLTFLFFIVNPAWNIGHSVHCLDDENLEMCPRTPLALVTRPHGLCVTTSR